MKKVSKITMLAYKNIFRYKRRSLLTGIVITISVISIIIAVGLGEAFYQQLIKGGINTLTGHIQISRKDWDFDIINPLSGSTPLIETPEVIEKHLRSEKQIKAFSREIIYPVVLQTGKEKNFYPVTIGTVLENISNISPDLLLPDDFSPKSTNMFWASSYIESYLQSKRGDSLVLLTSTLDGGIDGMKLQYGGLAQSMPMFTDQIIYMSYQTLAELLDVEGKAHIIKILLNNIEDYREVVDKISAIADEKGWDIKVTGWKELGAFYYHIALIGRFLIAIAMGILAIVAAIVVINTMLMAVTERTREIGTMMAIGWRQKDIVLLFLCEAVVLGLLFSTIGGIIGSILTFLLGNVGLGSGLQLLLEGKLYPVLSWHSTVIAIIWAFVICIISGLYPAIKASRMRPIEAVRYV